MVPRVYLRQPANGCTGELDDRFLEAVLGELGPADRGAEALRGAPDAALARALGRGPQAQALDRGGVEDLGAVGAGVDREDALAPGGPYSFTKK